MKVTQPAAPADLTRPSEAVLEMQTLQAALSRRGPRLRFDAPLEQAYERDTGGRRAKRIFYCNLLGTADFWLLADIDMHKLSHVATTLASLRDAILAFCAVGLLWLWLRLKHLTALEREWITASGAVMMAAYIGFEAHEARDVLGVMVGNNSMTVILFSCLICRLRFPVALTVTLLMLAIYSLAASAYDPLTHAIVLNHAALFVGIAVVSLSGNHLLERKERRAYLMRRLSLLQRDAVLASAEALRKLTLHDPLTGLANRRHFDSEIDQAWRGEQAAGAPVGLLQIDVDFFKRYNDCYGHPMGDACLQSIGASLSEAAREHGGLAARIGGEEFALLLPGLNLARASAAADRLCSAIGALKIEHRGSAAAPFVTVSVGVASMQPGDTKDPAALMLAADLALYRAKREGRNRFAPADTTPARTEADATAGLPDWKAPNRSEPAPRPAGARVEELRRLLAAGRLSLRFPPGPEAIYQERSGLRRQRWLAMLAFTGLATTISYVWLGLPLHADIGSDLMRGTLVLCGVLALPWAAVLRRPIPWYWRETLLSATSSALVLGLLLLGAKSQSPGMQSSVVSLSLVTIVATLLAAPPVRFSVAPCALLCTGVGALTWWSDPADRARWLSALYILLATSVYSLIGAYLLDLSNRRGYVLRRLGEAQIAELQEINADLQRVALTDTLTGLPNRRHFESQMSALWAKCQSSDSSLALLIIDIDHFKAYNDNYGHLAGDACLHSVGAFIAAWCAQQPPFPGQCASAFAARLGGEEFGVLLPGHSAQSALGAAERLRAGLQARRSPHAHSPVSDVLTASIGAACQRPSSSPDLRQLLRVADEALYRAKAAGRNRVST